MLHPFLVCTGIGNLNLMQFIPLLEVSISNFGCSLETYWGQRIYVRSGLFRIQTWKSIFLSRA